MLNCFILKARTHVIFSSSLLLISRYGIQVEPSSSFSTSNNCIKVYLGMIQVLSINLFILYYNFCWILLILMFFLVYFWLIVMFCRHALVVKRHVWVLYFPVWLVRNCGKILKFVPSNIVFFFGGALRQYSQWSPQGYDRK